MSIRFATCPGLHSARTYLFRRRQTFEVISATLSCRRFVCWVVRSALLEAGEERSMYEVLIRRRAATLLLRTAPSDRFATQAV